MRILLKMRPIRDLSFKSNWSAKSGYRLKGPKMRAFCIGNAKLFNLIKQWASTLVDAGNNYFGEERRPFAATDGWDTSSMREFPPAPPSRIISPPNKRYDDSDLVEMPKFVPYGFEWVNNGGEQIRKPFFYSLYHYILIKIRLLGWEELN